MNGRAIAGLLICGAGVVFTFVIRTGFIWYGAIIWGAIMFIQGLTRGGES